MGKFYKALAIGAILMSPLAANASVHMKVFVNGYQTTYKNETFGGVHYDSITYQLIKMKDRGEYLNRAIVVRDADNKYSISYKTVNQLRNFDEVLVDVMNGDFRGVSDLKIESTEILPKSKLLVLFRKNVPVTNYINKCINGDLVSHYIVNDSDLDATVDAGSNLHFKFKVNLDQRKIVSSDQPVSNCESALVDGYKGLLDVKKLSPMIAALSTAKAHAETHVKPAIVESVFSQ